MRYSRNIKIFRGGVDAAPFASLFFIVVLFTMLFYSHVFFPSVPIKIADEEAPPEMLLRTVKVNAAGEISFLGNSYNMEEFKRELQARGQKGTLPRRVVIDTEPSANQRTVTQVGNLLKGAGIALKLPGSRLELPDYTDFAGARNPVVVVGMNLNGQLFFQHQLVSEKVLQEKLKQAVSLSSEPLTLLLQVDKNVPAGKLVALAQLALRSRISDFRIATKPAPDEFRGGS
jgi:biopolymer transport protein ExbD